METATAPSTEPTCVMDPLMLSGMSGAGLRLHLEALFAERRLLDAAIAQVGGEVGERSQASLGGNGLARMNGYSTAAGMVAAIGRIGIAEAGRFCRTGAATATRTSLTGEQLRPVFETLAAALNAGMVTVEAASHIVTQLNQARPRATVDDLLAAENALVTLATEATADDVRAIAARWRDALDADGIEPREAQLVAARSMKRMILANGMKRFIIDLDPLRAGYLDTAIDAELAANLRAVGFTGHDHDLPDTSGAGAGAGELANEVRTLPQLGADVFVDMIRHALSCENTSPALASATVVVRITEEALNTGHGHATIDGGEQPISASTARQIAAEGDMIPMVLGGESDILDYGRTRRLFSKGQRIAMIERDGGCIEGCNRPAVYLEAHHIKWWERDDGRTDLDNGVLVCTRVHTLIHQYGWEIRIENNLPWLIPPKSIDPRQKPRRGRRTPIPQRV